MTILDALQNVQRVFLDTAPVVYFVEKNAAYLGRVDPLFDRLDAGTLQAVTSPVTLAECLVVPIRLGLTNVIQDFTDLIVGGQNVAFVGLNAVIARQAAELRAGRGLRLADAFQIAAALAMACDAVVTNDRGLKQVQEITIIYLDDLEP